VLHLCTSRKILAKIAGTVAACNLYAPFYHHQHHECDMYEFPF